ncbi:MAG: heavy-metal-associated domain-containing protein, partial [Gammaproteobacteria bacterium]|nr:heavy-metal-associated domain-containing protein [Gammaproteobacteria bacterium]
MSKQDYMHVKSAYDTKHWIRVPALNHRFDADAILNNLNIIPGVHEVLTEIRHKRVRVLYDQTQIDYLSIEDALAEVGFPAETRWWWRLKGSWFQYLDSNARENFSAPSAPCCSHP